MNGSLRDLEVLVVDCQAGGATPAHGDLLELGWALCGQAGIAGEVKSRWIVPRTDRRVPRAIRGLTGWSEACLAEAVPEEQAWAALHEDALRLAAKSPSARAPAVIHFARFELPFLRDLHARLGAGEFPLDPRCLHAIAARLFPDLPRRNIRALAGYLGHSAGLLRRAAGHVEATAFIWSAVVPRLEELGVGTWDELDAWLEQPARVARRGPRVYPLAPERRQALPDRPGVYRFVRSNGDVLYVGKAARIKKRVAGHFRSGAQQTERGLELLTQVHDIVFTETESILEAALLECDEIKSIDPPYNVQLRMQDRRAWFAARDLGDAVPAPDALHPIGPLPSPRAIAALPALIALVAGEQATPLLCAQALAVPITMTPDAELFAEGWRGFEAELPGAAEPTPARRVERAALALWLERRRAELEQAAEDAPPDAWDLARVRRRLDRSLIQSGLLARRARWLCLLADADVAFRDRGMDHARALVLSRGEVLARHDLVSVSALDSITARRMSPRFARQACFDAARYDRLRVLATELHRILTDSGEVAVRLGSRLLSGERLARLMRAV
jgi:DNA polymerase III subunit epsilon